MPRTRDQLVRLLHDAHNDVNRRLGKRQLSFEAHARLYGPTDVSPMRPSLVLSSSMCISLLVMAVAAFLFLRKRS